MNTLLAQIVSSETSKTAPVEVPEWGVTVHVRALTAGELATAYRAGHDGDFHLVHLGVVDDAGKRVFPSVDDVKARSPKAVQQLVKAIMAHNRLGPDADEDAEKKS